MILAHRRCDNQLTRSLDVVCAVAFDNVDAQRFEIAGRSGIRVAAGHDDSATGEQLGERPHSRPRYPDEMNRPRIRVIDGKHLCDAIALKPGLGSSFLLLAGDEGKNVRGNVSRRGWACPLQRLRLHPCELAGIAEH